MYQKKVIKPTHPLISCCVEYFLFFKNDAGIPETYTTFPNTNICLALFRQSDTVFDKPANETHIFTTTHQYKSTLTGLYNKSLTVHSSGILDEVCIIFRMDGIRSFTNIPFSELLHNNDVFEVIFGKNALFFCEQLFDEPDFDRRAQLLEAYLLANILSQHVVKPISHILHKIGTDSSLRSEQLAASLNISRTKLFRDFISHVGQSPKEYIDTVRFRKAMNLIVDKKHTNLTAVAYNLGYFDQAHFIHSFSKYAGASPSSFVKKVSVVDDIFVVGK